MHAYTVARDDLRYQEQNKQIASFRRGRQTGLLRAADPFDWLVETIETNQRGRVLPFRRSVEQNGKVGDITMGLPPFDYGSGLGHMMPKNIKVASQLSPTRNHLCILTEPPASQAAKRDCSTLKNVKKARLSVAGFFTFVDAVQVPGPR